jgi:AcrR family transcriptional regulator
MPGREPTRAPCPEWITIITDMNSSQPGRPYHHGDLAPALRAAARAILEEEGLAALSLRSVARRAGVSHAAPYRHYPSREALLADVAADGLAELRADIAQATLVRGDRSERVVQIGGA